MRKIFTNIIVSPGVAGAALEPPGPGPDLPEDAGVEDDQGRHGHQVQYHVHARGALTGVKTCCL